MKVHGSATPSEQIATRPCTRVFAGGYTFRLAKGDSHIAVWTCTYVEQRRVLIIRENPDLRSVVEGPLDIEFTIRKPDNLEWWDTGGLAVLAQRCVAGVPRGRT